MKNRQATRMFGMTVMGGITVNGPMFDIHDNQHLHFYNHDMLRQRRRKKKRGR